MFVKSNILNQSLLYITTGIFIPMLLISIYYVFDNLRHIRELKLLKHRGFLISTQAIILIINIILVLMNLELAIKGIFIHIIGLSFMLIFSSPMTIIVSFTFAYLIQVVIGKISIGVLSYNLFIIGITTFMGYYIFRFLNRFRLGMSLIMFSLNIVIYLVMDFFHSFFISISGTTILDITYGKLFVFKEVFLTVLIFLFPLLIIDTFSSIFIYMFFKLRIPELLFVFRVDNWRLSGKKLDFSNKE